MGAGASMPAPGVHLGLQLVAGGFANPLWLTTRPTDSSSTLFIVEQGGRIRLLRAGSIVPTPFLDISGGDFSTGGEQGLLSMAFDPNYATNGFFYIFYTDGSGRLAVDRYTVSGTNADLADTASALRIITIDHPGQSNHNGGLLQFGLDGFLYIGAGDGGGVGDPSGNAQNTSVLLGKILRIDVRASTQAQPYVTPRDNPFLAPARPEIWAYGLRNPWRYAFDSATSNIYIADVGEAREEEVDVQPAATASATASGGGINYGWNITEGTLCFNPMSGCNTAGITMPVLEYDHSQGCAIIGGFVYHGSAIPEIQGRYFYSDLCAGFLRSFLFAGGVATEQTDWGITSVGSILSFGQDAQDELYMLSTTSVYRIVKQ
jgi:glucose/arabinose dehydrogenase